MASKPRHILVIRLSAMGDVAMTVPILLALREQHPDCRITVLTKPFYGTILDQVPGITLRAAEVKGKHKGAIGLWRLFKELGTLDIDAVADLHNVLRSKILRGFFKLHNARVRYIDKGRKEKRQLTALRGKRFEPLKTTHERYADVFRKMDVPLQLKTSHLLPKAPLPKELRSVFEQDRAVIGIAPFAAFAGKTYPKTLMQKVLERLNEEDRLTVLLFGGGAVEKERLASWAASYENCISVAGRFSFAEELRIISNLELMVAMDSGNAHLAAMYGLPTLTLWGVTHPHAGFYPFAQPSENALLADRSQYPLLPTSVYGNKQVPGYGQEVMQTIAPETVVHYIHRILGKKQD